MQRIVKGGWRIYRSLPACALFLLAASALPAAEPFLQKTSLFTEETDGGRTWPVSQILQSGPSAYSDLAVLPDGTMLCFYESGDPSSPKKYGRPWAYSFLTVAHFNLEWLLSDHDSAKPLGTADAKP